MATPLKSRTLTVPPERCFSCRSPLLISPPPPCIVRRGGGHATQPRLSGETACVQRRNTASQLSFLPRGRQQQFSGILQLQLPPVSEAPKLLARSPTAAAVAVWYFFFTPPSFRFVLPDQPPLISSCCASRCDAVCFSFHPITKTRFPLISFFIFASPSLQLLHGPP